MFFRSVVPYLLAMAVTSSALAGNLNPPTGTVAPTGRFGPRVEINAVNTPGDADSLFRITRSGSYYLGSNLTGVAGRHGIKISTNSVTIDLMGFELQGTDSSFDGITADGPHRDLTIRNGTVTLWGNDGIDLVGSGAGEGSLIESVHATSNSLYGIRGNQIGLIRNCTAVQNGSSGFTGGQGSSFVSCAARLNGAAGIFGGGASIITGCTVLNNSGVGISAGGLSVITQCSTLSSGGDGISLSSGGTISECVAAFNQIDGIRSGPGSSILFCNSYANNGDSIETSNDCLVLRNRCSSAGNGANDGAGIHATGLRNRIEGNIVIASDRGIDVDATSNLIIRNSVSNNSINYSIVANNKIGVIVLAPNSLAVSGSTGGAGVGTTNPWANFSY